MAAGKKKKATRRKQEEETEEISEDETEEGEDEDGEDEDEDEDGEDEDEDEDEDSEEEDSDSDEEGDEEEGESEPPSEPAKKLTKKEKVALFKEYQETADNIEVTREHLAVLQADLSKKVETIFNAMGHGPFDWKGQQIRIVQRKGRYSMRLLSSGAEKIG